jgi:hypothetical protein
LASSPTSSPIHAATYKKTAVGDRRQADHESAPGGDLHSVRLAGRRRQILAVNPAHVVRARIDARLTDACSKASTRLVGLRGRMPIGVMTCAFAHIDAVACVSVEDYPAGKRWRVRLYGKGGNRHEMPAHRKLEQFINQYVAAAGFSENGKTPFPIDDRQDWETQRQPNRSTSIAVVRRRTTNAGFKV